MTIGIMSAMREEIGSMLEELAVTQVIEAGHRTYYKGTLWGSRVVLVFSRWGKVAAATTATHLIEHFGVKRLIFTGVAGGVAEGLRVGDVVVASKLYQHDMDASPLYPRHEIPLLGRADFPTDPHLRRAAATAAQKFLATELRDWVAAEFLAEFRIAQPKVVQGVIASGDRFVAGRAERERLKRDWPSLDCVEMEGAAVAQVCLEYGVPLAVIRTISDTADEGAAADFSRFVQHVAGPYSHAILRNWLTSRRRPAVPSADDWLRRLASTAAARLRPARHGQQPESEEGLSS